MTKERLYQKLLLVLMEYPEAKIYPLLRVMEWGCPLCKKIVLLLDREAGVILRGREHPTPHEYDSFSSTICSVMKKDLRDWNPKRPDKTRSSRRMRRRLM